jgi:hypothetical protein
MTTFHSGDGYGTGSCTGSGLCEKDFTVNDKGWYLYKDRLVLAGATRYLLKHGYKEQIGKKYFTYGENVTVIIDGVSYPGTIWDSCGACTSSSNNIIDLFVSGPSAVFTKNVSVIY